METTVTTVTQDLPASEQPNEQLSGEATAAEVEETVEEVETVADEILVEVKQCQSRIDQVTEGLTRLQSEGATREQISEALTEVRNLREEMRNLLAELKELSRPASNQSTLSSLQSQQPPTEQITEINQEEVAAVQRAQSQPKKKKRYRI